MRRLALVLALLGTAGAQHATHSMPGKGGVATTMDMAAMNRQMVAALRPLKGRAFDVKFAQLMMDHHQGALDMAQAVTQQGKNAKVKAEAKKVIAAQRKEIALMTGWVRKWTGKVYVPTTMPMVMAGNVNYDRWFLQEMIPHHQGAVEMSKLAATRSGSSEVKKLALNIIKTQNAEIKTYQALLKTVK